MSPVLVEQPLDVQQAGTHNLLHGLIHRLGQRLLQLAHDEVVAANDLAVVGLEFARDQFQCRRLACAIATDQAHAFPGLDDEIGFPEDLQLAERQRYFFKPKQCHGLSWGRLQPRLKPCIVRRLIQLHEATMSEDRLVEIETKLAHQEHLLDELNNVITTQQATIMRLEERYEILVSKLRSISEALPADSEPDERPPHY